MREELSRFRYYVELIDKRGYELVSNPDEATVIVVNTCGFIDAAKRGSDAIRFWTWPI